MTDLDTRPGRNAATVRSYRIERRRTATGTVRYAVHGSCVRCERGSNAPVCQHEVLMPWRWASETDARQWIDAVTKAQQELLDAERGVDWRTGIADARAALDQAQRRQADGIPSAAPQTRRPTTRAIDPHRQQRRLPPPTPRRRR